MEYATVGKMILERRQSLGYTRQKVSFGLCSVSSLFRFEMGCQNLSFFCVEAILQRLGLPDDPFFAILTKKETEMLRLKHQIQSDRAFFESTTGAKKEEHRQAAFENIERLEQMLSNSDKINRQFILLQRLILGDPDRVISPEEQEARILDALRCTIPSFDDDEIHRYLLSYAESGLLVQWMNVLGSSGRFREEIHIGAQLVKNIQKNHPKHPILLSVQFNYARALVCEERFDEAAVIIDEAKKQCVCEEHYYALPSLLHLEAECRYYQTPAQSKAPAIAGHYLYKAMGLTRDAAMLDEDIDQRHGILFSNPDKDRFHQETRPCGQEERHPQ